MPRSRSISFFGASGMRSRALFRSLTKLATGMRDEHRPMAESAQPEDGHQDLILTTTPRSRRVDVEREHLSRLAKG